jgi:hypothetical protein
MIFYHIRYNTYPSNAAPVEKDEWLAFSTPHNEQQLKRLLIDRSRTDISIILHRLVCEQEYNDRVADASRLLKEQAEVDLNNLNEWNLDLPTRVRKTLNDQDAESDNRFRNIDKPPPLL